MLTLATSIFNSLLMVVLPLADALINGRSPATLLVMYVAESLVLLVLNPLRIRLHRAFTNANGHYLSAERTSEPQETLRRERGHTPNRFLASWFGLSSLFTLVQAAFVALFVFVVEACGPVRMNEIKPAVLYAASAQLAVFGMDAVTLRRWPFMVLQINVAGTIKRLLATQLGLLLGVPLLLLASPWAIPGTLFALRFLVDLAIDLSLLVATRDPGDVKRARAEAERWLSSPRDAPKTP